MARIFRRSHPGRTLLAVAALALALLAPGKPADKSVPPSPPASKAGEERHLSFPKYEIARVPFAPGETFEYAVTWNGIPAADGKAWVEGVVRNGRQFLDFHIATKTNAVIDILWKMRDSGTSTVDAATITPLGHRFVHRENDKERRYSTTFDHATRMVTCVREIVAKKRVEKVRMSYQFAFDPISAPYYMRCLDWKVGDRRRFELVEDNARYLFTMSAVAVEEISLPAGRFQALKMQTSLLRLAALRKKPEPAKEAEIWVSDDHYRLPLKLKTASFIGHIYVDLARFSLPSGEKPPSLRN